MHIIMGVKTKMNIELRILLGLSYMDVYVSILLPLTFLMYICIIYICTNIYIYIYIYTFLPPGHTIGPSPLSVLGQLIAMDPVLA